MKILVCVKEVEELEDDFELEGDRVDPKYFEYQLNEWDEYALEEAVQIKEESEEEVEVVTLTLGPERAEETIRMALAKGADRAVRVWEEEFEDRELLDSRTMAQILGAVVQEEDPEIVFTGVMANDSLLSSTGVSLAQHLDYEWAAVVNDLELDLDERVAHVHRELEGGIEELTDVDLPVVLTIQTGINDPRYASLRGIRQAQSKEIALQSLADLGLDSSVLDSPIRMTEMYEPETETETEYLEGNVSDISGQLLEILRDKGVLT